MPTSDHDTPVDWRTRAEATDYRETARYPEVVAYCRGLEAASPFVRVETIGRSPEGRDILALIVSLDGAFTPAEARATGKEILLVTACIHPGEPEGKDAGLALIRDLVIHEEYRTNGLLDSAILLFVPIHGVDGHERFGPYHRINQNGPAEQGWRTTAQNYNLNRDWLKADAPEMRAMLGLFHRWQPDLVVDVHTTNGADYQYDLTYSLERFDNQHPVIRAWQQEAFDGAIFPALTRMGHLIAPYIVLNDPVDPRKGFNDSATLPRFSTGYVALWNRPALLLETHMLKDYRSRVTGTYDVVAQILSYLRVSPGALRKCTAQADRETVAAGRAYDPDRRMPVTFARGPGHLPIDFLGVEYHTEMSAVSGTAWTWYDPAKPSTFTVPFYNEVFVHETITPPLGYIVPAAWTVIIERLNAHGIAYERLPAPQTLTVETFEFSQPEWEPRPFENHHAIKDVQTRVVQRRLTFPAGSAVVYLDQPAARVVMHLLEPASPDSLLRWGYLDAIFEAKEYADERVMERMSREMMARDPALAAEFARQLETDAAFAASPTARLEFFYRRTPYYDERLNVYPVGRLFARIAIG